MYNKIKQELLMKKYLARMSNFCETKIIRTFEKRL